MKKPRRSKRELADEAWLRLNTPDNTGALPGQLTIEGQIAEGINVRARGLASEIAALDGVPDACPACGAGMTMERGWTYSKFGPPTIQCRQCAGRWAVPDSAHAAYREAVRNYYALLRRPATAKKARRERGAR